MRAGFFRSGSQWRCGRDGDIEVIGAVGAHALPVITALTVQDNDRVYAVNPVDASILAYQTQVLIDKILVSAVKVGIVGNRENALAIRDAIAVLRKERPDIPVVLDTVLEVVTVSRWPTVYRNMRCHR